MSQPQPNVFSGFQGNFTPNVVTTVLTGQPFSGIIECKGQTLCGILFPVAFTGASVSFYASVDGTTFVQICDKTGAPILYDVAASTYTAIDPKDFYGVNYLKIKSGSNEGGTRTLAVALKGF